MRQYACRSQGRIDRATSPERRGCFRRFILEGEAVLSRHSIFHTVFLNNLSKSCCSHGNKLVITVREAVLLSGYVWLWNSPVM